MEILKRILKEKENRKQLIQEFQKLIWSDEKASEELSELAYDLDFYEPNEEFRKEDPSYYGDERLEEEIKLVLQKLNK